ncbi:MAG: 50S ribosomal protein L29 [Nanoarchaeota archaeon]
MKISRGTMKFKELKKLTNIEREKKAKELKMELIKANTSKTGGKARQIKKILARINTLKSLKTGEKK